MELTSVTIFRIVNGKVVEGWGELYKEFQSQGYGRDIRKTTLTVQQSISLNIALAFLGN